MKPRLLFVGATGRARAPIAAALAQALAGQNASVQYAQVSPGEIHPLAQQVMEERGITPPAGPLDMVAWRSGNCDYIFQLCNDVMPGDFQMAGTYPEQVNWRCMAPPQEGADDAAYLCLLRTFRDDMDRKLTDWLAGKNLHDPNCAAVQRVWRELARYEHPLFMWEAAPAGDSIEIRIRFRTSAATLHDYAFQMRPRELENPQFPWLFQKQLYDCLHDYVIELFSRNPQQDET
jgi:protein-tyrosine-phosphatase